MTGVQEGADEGSLLTHPQTQNGLAKLRLGSDGYKADMGGNKLRTKKMALTKRAGHRPCPVKRCSGGASKRTAMSMHFWHRHIKDTVVILEEGNFPHTWCSL